MSLTKHCEAISVLERCRSAKEALVLLLVADAYRDVSKRCDEPIEWFIRKSKLSRSSVDRALDNLEADGFLTIDRRYGVSFRIFLTLEAQLTLRAVDSPSARPKRRTGFAVRRPPADPRSTSDLGAAGDGLSPPNPRQGDVGPPEMNDVNPRQADVGTPEMNDVNPRQADVGTDLRLRSVAASHVLVPDLQVRTATAAPRLPFPIAVKPERPPSETAKLAKVHRLAKLRGRVAGYAIGILLDPVRQGHALIREPVTSYDTLVAATKERCGRKGVKDYHEVLDAMCASVWWRKSLNGQLVMAGKRPRPRDRR